MDLTYKPNDDELRPLRPTTIVIDDIEAPNPLTVEQQKEWTQEYIPRKIKVAYISGPYSAPTPHEIHANIRLAGQYAEKYWKLGYAVICPHLNSAFMDGIVPYGNFIAGDLEFVRRSDVIVMMPNWRSSNGAAAERLEAERCNKEIIYE